MTSEKGIQVHLRLLESAPAQGDVRQIQRAVANLLDNAVKYTPRGGTIALSVLLRGPNVQLSISNSGENISPKDLPNIFKRFYRADGSRCGSGNGLGLSLAKAIVEAHGGWISVCSTPGDHTVFVMSFPASQSVPTPVG
jgi:hypothetical protein